MTVTVHSGDAVREGDEVEVRGFGNRVLYRGVLERFVGNHALVLPEGKTKAIPAPLDRMRRVKRTAPSPGKLTRRPTTEAKLRRVPRPKGPARDAAYLAWVRKMPCCVCREAGPSHPHHQHPQSKKRGMGQKVSDYFVVPLCARCHAAWHDTGAVPGLPAREGQEHEAALNHFARLEAVLLERWTCRGGARAR